MPPDRLVYPLAALVVAALIALAMVYPQGEGARSVGLFGHPPAQQSPEAMALARHDAQVAEEQRKAALALEAQQKQNADGLRTTPLK